MLALLAVLFPTSDYFFYNAAFALRPLCVARDLGWCECNYPRWGGHNTIQHTLLVVLGSSASLIGSELPPIRLWPFALCPTPISHAASTSEGVDYSTGLGLRLYNACIVGR